MIFALYKNKYNPCKIFRDKNSECARCWAIKKGKPIFENFQHCTYTIFRRRNTVNRNRSCKFEFSCDEKNIHFSPLGRFLCNYIMFTVETLIYDGWNCSFNYNRINKRKNYLRRVVWPFVQKSSERCSQCQKLCKQQNSFKIWTWKYSLENEGSMQGKFCLPSK